jgi:hypothetical protein
VSGPDNERMAEGEEPGSNLLRVSQSGPEGPGGQGSKRGEPGNLWRSLGSVCERRVGRRTSLDRFALDEVLTPYPRNRLHDQHPRPPASLQSRQPNNPIYRGSILGSDAYSMIVFVFMARQSA